MKIVLTGGIACGKSTLAKFLRELGICLLDADDVVHELEAAGGEAVPAIVQRFGSEVLATDGSINRRLLADRVFFDSVARHDLESILFPLVRARLVAFAARRGASPYHEPSGRANRSGEPPRPINQEPGSRNQEPIRISVIPLLFESHWEKDYDIIITICSSEERQIERMMRTRGYSREQAKARLAAQMPVAEKARRADYVVANDSTPEYLRNEASRLLAWLKERKEDEH